MNLIYLNLCSPKPNQGEYTRLADVHVQNGTQWDKIQEAENANYKIYIDWRMEKKAAFFA